MDNDPIKSGGEEEFSFVEDQEAPKFEPSSDRKSSGVSTTSEGGSRRKKIIIIVVAIIALFFLYKLYGLFSTTSTKVPETTAASSAETSATDTTQATPQTPTSTVPAIETPSEQTTSPTEPVVQQQTQQVTTQEETVPEAVEQADKDIKAIESEETVKTAPSQDVETMNVKMSQLEQAIMENGQADENLQQQIGGLTSAISGIQDNISALTQQINSLADQIKTAQPATKAVAKSTKPKVTKHVSVKPPSSVYVPSVSGASMPASTTYFVKAMIQGRAWLITPDGATFTISSGDNLPGYGQILTIDPNKGIVMTSSGRVIGYMPEDR